MTSPRAVGFGLAAASALGTAMLSAQIQKTTIPLCPGLTIVTAVSQSDGDYESIKTVESVSDAEVRLKYSVERRQNDLLSTNDAIQKFTLHRTVRQADLRSAFLYEQQFSTELPETIPETTAIGASSAVLDALETKGESRFGTFIGYTQNRPSLDRNVHPNVYDNQEVGTIKRVGNAPVMVAVIVNDVPTELPAIRAAGEILGDRQEFYFLADRANPLTLQFALGVGAIKPLSADAAEICRAMHGSYAGLRCDMPNGGDRDTLRVVKITYRCGVPAEAGGGGGGGGTMPATGDLKLAPSGAQALEQALAKTGRADIYSIYFSFNSDTIREESEPTLKDIAEVLARHPGWRLAVNGHTDSIGTDKANLDLSRRRSAAVKDALVKRYAIAAGRLTTSGFGESQPRDTNDTLEGRAHNRRVELIRQ
jgi:outer membrane protein OmpA-like peptidoglycan-associated protein